MKPDKIPEISPSFCVYPWMQFMIGPVSSVQLCCIAEPVAEKGPVETLGKGSLEDLWNSQNLRTARKKMLAGHKLKACKNCYYQESIGRSSYRQQFNKQWLSSSHGENILKRVEASRSNGYKVEEPPLYLDIRPGNLCNLKCRMCNPANSSKIYQEQKELLSSPNSELAGLVETGYFKKDEWFYKWHKNKKIWRDIYKWAKGLRQIYFTGGEPTLIKENWELIDYLCEKGYSKNIDLIFNINCTQAPDKLLSVFPFFSSVNVTFSVDGYKETQEYIRYPSKWSVVEKNIIKILKNRRDNTKFYFSPVVQIYNILDLPRLLKWIDNLDYGPIGVSLIMCTGPEFLDIAVLPKNIKQEALAGIEKYERDYKGNDLYLLECLRAIKNILKSDESPRVKTEMKKFFKYTYLLDKKRGQSFEKALPQLNKRLNEDGRWKA